MDLIQAKTAFEFTSQSLSNIPFKQKHLIKGNGKTFHLLENNALTVNFIPKWITII